MSPAPRSGFGSICLLKGCINNVLAVVGLLYSNTHGCLIEERKNTGFVPQVKENSIHVGGSKMKTFNDMKKS